MAHEFASGHAKPQRTRIQQGVVTLLSGLKRSAGGYLMEVMPFAFTLKPTMNGDDVAQFVSSLSKAPSIAVAVGDGRGKIRTIGGFAFEEEVDLLVYFSSSNARNQQVGRMEIDTAGLANDMADPGIHVALEHARELLLGQRIADAGTDIKQIIPVSTEEVITAQPITIWLQTYKVTVLTQLDEFRTVDRLLESIRVRLAVNPAEVHLPATKTDIRTLDVNLDDLA